MSPTDQVVMCVTFLLVCVANALFIGRLRRKDPEAEKNVWGYLLFNVMNWWNAGVCAGTLLRMWWPPS